MAAAPIITTRSILSDWVGPDTHPINIHEPSAYSRETQWRGGSQECRCLS